MFLIQTTKTNWFTHVENTYFYSELYVPLLNGDSDHYITTEETSSRQEVEFLELQIEELNHLLH